MGDIIVITMSMFNYLFRILSTPFLSRYKRVMRRYNRYMVDSIILSLLMSPEYYSANWSDKNRIETSILSRDFNTQIMLEGCIIKPSMLTPTPHQLFRIRKLVKKIVERDILKIMNRFDK